MPNTNYWPALEACLQAYAYAAWPDLSPTSGYWRTTQIATLDFKLIAAPFCIIEWPSKVPVDADWSGGCNTMFSPEITYWRVVDTVGATDTEAQLLSDLYNMYNILLRNGLVMTYGSLAVGQALEVNQPDITEKSTINQAFLLRGIKKLAGSISVKILFGEIQ